MYIRLIILSVLLGWNCHANENICADLFNAKTNVTVLDNAAKDKIANRKKRKQLVTDALEFGFTEPELDHTLASFYELKKVRDFLFGQSKENIMIPISKIIFEDGSINTFKSNMRIEENIWGSRWDDIWEVATSSFHMVWKFDQPYWKHWGEEHFDIDAVPSQAQLLELNLVVYMNHIKQLLSYRTAFSPSRNNKLAPSLKRPDLDIQFPNSQTLVIAKNYQTGSVRISFFKNDSGGISKFIIESHFSDRKDGNGHYQFIVEPPDTK